MENEVLNLKREMGNSYFIAGWNHFQKKFMEFYCITRSKRGEKSMLKI